MHQTNVFGTGFVVCMCGLVSMGLAGSAYRQTAIVTNVGSSRGRKAANATFTAFGFLGVQLSDGTHCYVLAAAVANHVATRHWLWVFKGELFYRQIGNRRIILNFRMIERLCGGRVYDRAILWFAP